MKVIPVIDYLQGHVVLAKYGLRERYQAINSKLCTSTEPAHVIESILSITDFNTIYIADLDSIENNQIDPEIWQTLVSRYPEIEFWLDIGWQATNWLELFGDQSNLKPVIGSESFSSIAALSSTLTTLKHFSPILSLDFKDNQLLGPQALFNELRVWPQNVILLNLSQVGSLQGPDFSTLNKIAHQLPDDCCLFLGGGIKDGNDLQRAKENNFSGVLIASALHNETVTQKELLQFTC